MKKLLLITHPDDELDPGLSAVLAGRGDFETIPAEHGLDALFRLAQGGIDLLVLLVRDAHPDGVVVTGIVRERPSYVNLPIIVLAPSLTCSEQRTLRLAGVDHVLPLPCAPTVLGRCLDEALTTREREPGLLERLARAWDGAAGAPMVHMTLLRD